MVRPGGARYKGRGDGDERERIDAWELPVVKELVKDDQALTSVSHGEKEEEKLFRDCRSDVAFDEEEIEKGPCEYSRRLRAWPESF